MKIIAVLFLFLFTSSLTAQRWPLNPQNIQYPIVGTIGEDRGSRTRFHKGCDIAKSAGTVVVSIEDGIVSSRGGASLCVGTYCYIHVVPLPSIVLGDTISNGDTIGVIQNITYQHIHLQKTDSLYNRIPNVNVDTILWANSLNFLSPFVDNSTPDVQHIFVYEYQSYGNIVGNDLYGDLDVIINVTDPRITANGGDGNANNNQGVAPYSMSYMLLDQTQVDTFYRHENTFEFAPDNANSGLIFTQNTNFGTSDYEYYLNSYFREVPIRRPFNVRMSTGIGLAETPDSVKLSDGEEMMLKVNACDIVGNCDEEIYKQNGSNYLFTLDNFKPYIKSISASIHGVLVYDFNWETIDGKLEPRGGVVASIPSFTAFDLVQGMVVEVVASEQLDTLILNLDRNIDSCGEENDPNLTAVGIAQINRKNWVFTFGNLASCPFDGGTIDPTGGDWRFQFTGQDYGPDGNPGSSLIDFSGAYDVIVDRAQNTIPQLALDHRVSITPGREWSGTQDASGPAGKS